MLTPIDIQNRNLKTTMGGYNKKDTDDFLASILESYEELYKENKDLKEKITSLSEGIQYYKQMENTLQKALVLAEKTSTETQEAAKVQADSVMRESQVKAEALVSDAQVKADSLVSDAQSKAKTLVTDAQNKADTLISDAQNKAGLVKNQSEHELAETRSHIHKLVQSYESYRLQFKKLASSQIEMLESEVFDIYAPEIDNVVEEAARAELEAETVETLETVEEKNEELFEPVAETSEEPSMADSDLTDDSSVNVAENNANITENIENTFEPVKETKTESVVSDAESVESKIEWTEPAVLESTPEPVVESVVEKITEPVVESVVEKVTEPVSESNPKPVDTVSESPFINPLDMLETSTPFVDIPGTSSDNATSNDKVDSSPFIDIPEMPEAKKEKKASDAKESPFVMSFDDLTTPVVDNVKGADVSGTAYPETKKEENTPSYVDYIMPNVVEKPENVQKETAASKDSNPFVFIDPE